MTHRSGFVALVGRPNTGKSTLTNAMVGEKVAITSARPQTTRHIVRGIVHTEDAELVLVDTPGVHRPRTLLGQRLNDLVRETWAEVDLIAMCVPADESVGPGDQFIARQIAMAKGKPLVAIVTKVDRVSRDRIAERLMQVAELARSNDFEWAEVVPVSAVAGDQVQLLASLLVKLLPDGPSMYPEDSTTDEPLDVRIAEFIREAALAGVRDELPHSIAVLVDEIVPRDARPAERPLTDVRAEIYVERDSQKAIVIGPGGQRLKQVGSTARIEIEELLGTPVFLDLRVKVAKDWQRDPKLLKRLGF